MYRAIGSYIAFIIAVTAVVSLALYGVAHKLMPVLSTNEGVIYGPPVDTPCQSGGAIHQEWSNESATALLYVIDNDVGSCLLLVNEGRARGGNTRAMNITVESTGGDLLFKDKGPVVLWVGGYTIPYGQCAKVIVEAWWSSTEPETMQRSICPQLDKANVL